jgi:hypothetical protein
VIFIYIVEIILVQKLTGNKFLEEKKQVMTPFRPFTSIGYSYLLLSGKRSWQKVFQGEPP